MICLLSAAGWTLDMIGASAFTWEIQHVLGHHPYTNLMSTKNEIRKTKDDQKTKDNQKTLETDTRDTFCQESDPDVFSSFPLMRMHPSHPRRPIHKYQHIYAPVLFSLMTLSKVFMQDLQMFTYRRLYHISAR